MTNLIGLAGWIILVILLGVSVALIPQALRKPKSAYSMECYGMWWVLIGAIWLLWFCWPFISYYNNRIALPEEYKATCQSINETQALIRIDEQFNLEDVEINKALSELIAKKNKFEAHYRKSLRNPLVLIKPLPLEKP